MEASKIFDPVIDLLWDRAIKQVTYVFYYEKNVDGLNKRFKRLREIKARLDREHDLAKRKGDIVEPRVEEWFEEVGEFETKVEKYQKNAGHKKTRGFYYLFPYYRHKLGRQAKKMEMEASQLGDECPKSDEVFHAEKVTCFGLTSSNPDYVEFDSRKSIIKDIMTKLEDPIVKIIGLHGSQGMGKSTLIKEIVNKVRHEKLFDKVAQIDVTINPNPIKIQEEIAYVLGLKLEGESENVRADYLRRWLKIENVNILVILDNLYERLDLDTLGIPVDDDYNLRKKNELIISASADGTQGTENKVLKKENFLGDYKGCKILLSSRDKKIFSDDVESNFNLKELDDNESLLLFEKMVGGGNQMPKEEIKNYCAGSPMRIVSFATKFKNWSESINEPTLEKFKKQSLVEWQKSVDSADKIKYDLPKKEELRFLCLLCAQMGHPSPVMDLVKYSLEWVYLKGYPRLVKLDGK